MADIIFYATANDVDLIRRWINSESEIAWIVKDSQIGSAYRWRAVREIKSLHEGSYSIWHIGSGALNIPSGSRKIPDRTVADPFGSWTQVLQDEQADTPWFGSNLPGPITLTWRETGREQPRSLGRSGFNWGGDWYAPIGKPAHPDAKRWWQRLKRFVASNAARTPWPMDRTDSKRSAFVFPEALAQIALGRHADVNP